MNAGAGQSIVSRRGAELRTRYGPWAVVTGASSGIGREIARRLAEGKFNLVLIARRKDELERLAAQFAADHGIEARVLAVDLAIPASIEQIGAATDGLDAGLLVNSAGFGSSGKFLDARLDAELNMLQVNCGALFGLSLLFARRFAARQRGGLVFLSSILAFQGAPFAANYAATKAYVQSLAEALRIELAPFGVDVLSSAPGPTRSGFEARAGMQYGATVTPAGVAEATLGALGRKSLVYPGRLSKFLNLALSPLPRPVRVRMMGRVMNGIARGPDATSAETRSRPA